MNKKIAFSVLFLTIFGMLPAMTAFAADNTWTQTDWTGGGDGGSGPTHPANDADWNKYSSADGISGTNSPGNAVLLKTSFHDAGAELTARLGGGINSVRAYVSPVFDVGSNVYFGTLSWSENLIYPGMTLTLSTRTGSTPEPDGTWSDFSPELSDPDGSAITSPAGRYIQYAATVRSPHVSEYGVLYSVSIRSFDTPELKRHVASSELVSSVFDTAERNNSISGLSWTEDATLPAGASVRVRLRTAQTAGGFVDNWQEFTDTTAGCSKSSGTVTCPASSIPVPLTDGGDNRFIQYKLILVSHDLTVLPSVGNVAVAYHATAEQPPNTLIDDRPHGRLNLGSAEFAFHATKSGSTFECRIDLASFAPCTSPKSYTGLAEGVRAFQVRATDTAGNADATPTTVKWTIDTTPPNTIILLRPSGSVNPDTATFTFIATHTTPTGNTFECKIGDLYGSYGFKPCTSPTTYTRLRDGSVYSFQVRATDSAGNIDPTPTIARWAVGSPGPNTLIDLRPSGRLDDAAVSFTFHATENGSILSDATFECRLDAEEFAPCTAPKNYAGIAAGGHTFQVRATDAAGLTDATPTTAQWRNGYNCSDDANACRPTTAE